MEQSHREAALADLRLGDEAAALDDLTQSDLFNECAEASMKAESEVTLNRSES
jgi:hypothetical protein